MALGYSGNLELLPALLGALENQDDPLVPKLAAQAIARIAGLDPRADAYARARPKNPTDGDANDRQEAAKALPALEEDDLDADLVEWPEDDLPVPNAEALRRACEAAVQAPGKRPPPRPWLADEPPAVSEPLPLRTAYLTSVLTMAARGKPLATRISLRSRLRCRALRYSNTTRTIPSVLAWR